VPEQHSKYITVQYKNVPIPADILRSNQILDITIHANLVPKEVQYINGSLKVYTSSNNAKPSLKVPFYAIMLHGSLDFNLEDVNFHISPSANVKPEQCQSVKLINRFNTTIAVYNITLDNIEASKYIKVK
jgi:hypothetical protein